jgi:hypothetical protein
VAAFPEIYDRLGVGVELQLLRAGKPTTKIIDEIGDRWASLAKVVQMNCLGSSAAKPNTVSSPNE